jgi:hypothetical protein
MKYLMSLILLCISIPALSCVKLNPDYINVTSIKTGYIVYTTNGSFFIDDLNHTNDLCVTLPII